ncbi:ABC transporter permease [Reichenbachiella sp. MALMAid0571]|uniref:ABC transporter permease n=1 Tax=Reichenbachiella sp. MALMAid0571 TaxID=3143939 RepID=UPI0032DFBFE0
MKPQDSSFAIRFLRWFCHPDLLEDIEGDLNELYEKKVEEKGITTAKWFYFLEVVKLFRSEIIKNGEAYNRLNQYGMLKSYLKTSIRSIKRNMLFSGINVVGLAISMAVGILMIVLLTELYSFDDFHAKKENIYRVTSTYPNNGDIIHFASSSIYIGKQIEEQVPGVDKMVIMRRDMWADIKTPNGSVSTSGHYASASFFDVFSFNLIKGNPNTVLVEPSSIVLTKSMAEKLFGEANPIGKTVEVERNSFLKKGTITGVVEDPPINSHIQFDALVSLKTLEQHVEGEEKNLVNNFESIWTNYVYLVLNNEVIKDQVQQTMNEIMVTKNNMADNGKPIMHELQRLTDIVPSGDYFNEIGPTYLKSRIFIMLVLTLIVLLSACFNYTNLSLARALRRSKEVAIRKVSGATHFQIFCQFIVESLILSLVAVVAGLGLFYVIKPEFMSLPNDTANGYQMYSLNIEFWQFFLFLVFALFIGMIAGLIPAAFLSQLKAKIIMKDAGRLNAFSGMTLRRILIVFQFAMSIGLITCAFIVHKQYQFSVNYDLGYDTENVINVSIHGDYIDLLENEYSKIPNVLQTARSATILGVGSSWGNTAISEDRSDTVNFMLNFVDHKYLDMYQFELIAGSGFSTSPKKDEKSKYIVVNEKFLQEMNLGSPQKAVGKTIWPNSNKAGLRIIGVVKDFVDASLWESTRPFGFMQTNSLDDYRVLGVKVMGDDLLSTVAKMEEKYLELDPVHPFEAIFYNDRIAQTYQQQKTIYKIISFLAFIAISISTLGLLGMAVFTTESRMKEISIRKVLGSGISNLILLLSRGFFWTLVVAGAVAVPIALYLVDDLVLNDFVYKTEIGVIEILSGFLTVLIIGVITMGWQIRQAVIQNPADLLRDE